MSNAVYPSSIPGIGIKVLRSPQFATQIQSSVSGYEARATFQAYPKRKFVLQYEFLRHTAVLNELRTLEGFFLARRGAYDSFLFTDPADNSVTDQLLGTGNGVTTQFQAQRTFGYGTNATFTEPLQNINVLTNIKINGVVSAAYTVDASGLFTTTAPVPNGQTITWSGTYYYRCRFLQDESEVEQFLYNIYKLGKVEMIGALLNKV